MPSAITSRVIKQLDCSVARGLRRTAANDAWKYSPSSCRQISPNSTWLVTSRLDTTRHVRRVVRVARVVTNVTSRACFKMADDEEAVVIACTSLVFCALDLHRSQERLPEKVSWTCPPQSTLWRRPWKRVVRLAPVALVVTNVSRRAAGQARHVWLRVTSLFHYA